MTSGSGWNLWLWFAGSGCGWNLCVWLVGVVVRRYIYIDFLILFIPTPLVCALFFQQHRYFLFILKMFFVLVPVLFCNLCNNFFSQYKHTYRRLRASHGGRMKGCT